jgi:hypothetical protein
MFYYCSRRPLIIAEKSMQSVRPDDLPSAVNQPSPVSGAIDRVVTIAPAPLLPGEKETDYAEIALRIVKAAPPRDAIEEFLVRDVIDLTWEILRLRRVKAGILRASMGVGVERVLAGVDCAYLETAKLRDGWVVGNDSARTKVDVILNKAGLTIDEATAKTLESKLDSFERLDRMLASAEARRNNALREIDRHRDALGGGVRRSIEEIEDAEFRDVATGRTPAGEKP